MSSLSSYAGLDKMISEAEQNVARLRSTIDSGAYQAGYVENCKQALRCEESSLQNLLAAKRKRDSNLYY